ncbi:MAG: YtxH domain-containing protein [Ruminococcus sp.]|nr:YtxH domain-containing protein [Ruminococcus sp.]MDE7225364.1 YtxH domain-containing protein [Ruminococcus sp.]
MNKFLAGMLVTGAAVAAGVVISKLFNKSKSVTDFDEDEFDYLDPYDDTDEPIEYDINEAEPTETTEEIADEAEKSASVEVVVEDSENTETEEEKTEE